MMVSHNPTEPTPNGNLCRNDIKGIQRKIPRAENKNYYNGVQDCNNLKPAQPAHLELEGEKYQLQYYLENCVPKKNTNSYSNLGQDL